MTELLRRRCSNIMVVDASGAADPRRHRLAPSRSLERSSASRSSLDPRPTCPGEDGLADRRWRSGSSSTQTDSEAHRFARCVLWNGAPADLQLLAAQDRLFPNHPTGNQFLSGELFDAYRALGYAVGIELASKVGLPPPEHDESRTGEGSPIHAEALMVQRYPLHD